MPTTNAAGRAVTTDLRRGQVVGDASRRWLGLNAVTHDVASATYAPIASPVFTGDPKAPTPAPGDNDTSIATTAFVTAGDNLRVLKAGDTMTGQLTVNPNILIGNPVPSPPAHTLIINDNAAAPAAALAPDAPSRLRAYGVDGTFAALDVVSNPAPILRTIAYAGTLAAPTAVPQFGGLGSWNANGYDGTALGGGPAIVGGTIEAWTPTAHGCVLDFYTVSSGTTAQVKRLEVVRGLLVLDAGGVNPTGGDQGPGTINATSGYYLNGANITGGHLRGTQTNDSAAAGEVGEVVQAINTTGTALPTGTSVTIASISLTAGDWDVQGEVFFLTCTGNPIQAGINSVATIPGGPGFGVALTISPPTGNGYTIVPLSPVRASLASTTTYYLIANQTGSTGSPTGQGKIWARRRR